MSAAVLDRAAGSTSGPGVRRAVQLAEISAETAEWIAGDLERREAGAGTYAAAAGRIRQRAAGYRAVAERLRPDPADR